MMPNAQRSMVLDEVKLERYRNLLASTAMAAGVREATVSAGARELGAREPPLDRTRRVCAQQRNEGIAGLCADGWQSVLGRLEDDTGHR